MSPPFFRYHRTKRRRRGGSRPILEGRGSVDPTSRHVWFRAMNSPCEVNVLLTSVGRRVELVRAFREAYARLGIGGKIFATDSDWLAPAAHHVDHCTLVPEVIDPRYPRILLDICRRHRIDLVLPLIDPDIPILAEIKELLAADGTRAAVVDRGAAAIGADKWSTFQFFSRIGLPTPESWLATDMGIPERFPLFVKPRDGSAAINTFRVNGSWELDFFRQYVPRALVQEFVPGAEITTDVLCDFQGRVVAMASRRRIAVRGGEALKSITGHFPAVTAGCEAIARALPAVGPITVQCILRGEEPVFTEINARLGGGLPLAIAAGADFPGFLLRLAADLPLPEPIPDYRDGVYMTRCDDSLFLRADNGDHLDRRYL